MTIALKVQADETVDSKLAGLERKGRVLSLLLENIPHIEFGVMAYFNSSSTEACVSCTKPWAVYENSPAMI